MNNIYNPSLNVLAHSQIQQQTQNGSEATGVENLQSPPVPNISYLQTNSLNHHSQPLTAHQHLAAMGGTHTTAIYDPRQLHSINGLDKTFFAGSASNIGANGTATGRYFTTANAAVTHPSTILITNNFTPQQQQSSMPTHQHHDPQRAAISSNLRIVSAATGNSLHQPHIFNAQNNIGKELANTDLIHIQQLPAGQQQQIYQQQLLQHSQYASQQQQLSALLPLQTANSHYAPAHFGQQHHALQQFYTPTPVTTTNTSDVCTNVKLMSTNAATSTLAPSPTMTGTATTANSSSTVVLDRINICINNHYTDAAASPAASSTSLSTTPSQQPSPIIPAIQHKAVVDSANGLFIDPYASNESTSIVIDEPDSTTTTPHTPPTTPENISLSMSLSALPIPTTQSPTTTTTTSKIILTPENILNTALTMHQPATCAESVADNTENTQLLLKESPQIATQVPPTPPTPPKPTPQTPNPQTPTRQTPTTPITLQTLTEFPDFAIGEDVLIKRSDERFYLGTIIDMERHQYLVRFDDKSELWSEADEMRKLNGGDISKNGQMCVACKRSETADIVEVCERCGRGYHRNCTNETVQGSGNWICKRCAKPMKMLKTSICLDKKSSVCRQLPYDVGSLNWDEKHRVNQEQIYCYCGKSGKFDDNMLQCCRCRNWYHTDCILCFKNKILRGDGFFVFCCSVCNNGEEFLRRLQMNWVDLLHLTLYNLSAIKKHQNQKYHHLIKDIWPFVLERRCTLPIPKAWVEMPEDEFKEKIKRTLNAERFMSGKEIKKDPLYYALRSNGPPILPEINIQENDVLTDELLTDSLELTLLKGAPENEQPDVVFDDFCPSEPKIEKMKLNEPQDQEADTQNDVYEFRIEDEDEKFTSDDEIPIKHIMEKVKKNITPEKPATNTCQQKITISSVNKNVDIDDFSNTLIPHSTQKSQPQKYDKKQHKNETSTDSPMQSNLKKIDSKLDLPVKSSRKRKAFTLSKIYKESATEIDTRICDSSSDENSSSSRGTSLDLIIPPPKNFLGLNNPFRMVTPKKNANGGGDKKTVTFARRGPTVKNSIFTTTSLDFSSKLAALKSSGIFSNLSSSELAKAAGQPRLVRTIKRRLSAKDITIGPNQEVRRRRIRRLSSNVEVISTTTINPIPSNFFPIHAKDLITSTATNHKLSSSSNQHLTTTTTTTNNNENSNTTPSSTTSSVSSCSVDFSMSISATAAAVAPPPKPSHGRRLRQRPDKNSPNNSRRSSISGASTSSSSSLLSANAAAAAPTQAGTTILDLKQSVTKYFGAVNRIESGENFSIRAKRRLANGQMQYLIEWGGDVTTTS